MPIKIDDGFMSLEIDGKVVATARERTGGHEQLPEAANLITRCDWVAQLRRSRPADLAAV